MVHINCRHMGNAFVAGCHERESTSKEFRDFCTKNGVKNFFSTPCHNGLAEPSIILIMKLDKIGAAQQGLEACFE